MLTWENQLIDLTAKPTEKEVMGTFSFTNSGISSVTIITIQPNCACTTAELTKRRYAPGESGTIKAVYTIGHTTGKQRRMISVTTDDPSERPVDLTLKVTIPELLAYSSKILLWHIDDKLEEKIVTISSATSRKILRIEINAIIPTAAATARIEPSSTENSFQLLVSLVSTVQPIQVGLSCTATLGDDTTQSFTVFAVVK